jgi:hypothetical protein
VTAVLQPAQLHEFAVAAVTAAFRETASAGMGETHRVCFDLTKICTKKM